MVSGVGMSAAYALVVPAEEMRPRLSDPEARAQFEGEMAALLDRVNSEVADYEQLAMLVLAREAWSIESGTLTPTMKIRRSRIESAVAPQVQSWYGNKGKVLWA